VEEYKRALEMLKSGQNSKFAEGLASQLGGAVSEGLKSAMPTQPSGAPTDLLAKAAGKPAGGMVGRKVEVEFGTPNIELPAMELDMSRPSGDPAKDAAERLRKALSSGSFANLASSKNFGHY